VTFRARVVRPANIWVEWSVRDRISPNWASSQQTPQYQDFRWRVPGMGVWQVQCVLEDRDPRIRTPRIRALARQKHIWNLIAV
jgi:hypothetical protein